jgi:chemotaxis signal transduction protein
MNNNMTVGINQVTIAANNVNNDSLLKLLVFEVGKLILALSIQQVQKVVRNNPVYGSGLSYVNLTHLGDQEVTVIDLHQKLFKVSQTETSGTGYFIISKNVTGEPLGIAVAQTPTVIDVPLAQIRTLPESYRRADTLEIASHVAVIPQENNTSLTIFILDLERLV